MAVESEFDNRDLLAASSGLNRTSGTKYAFNFWPNRPLVVFVQRNRAGDYTLEVLWIFVSDGLVGIDRGKDIAQGIAMASRKDH